MQPEGYHILARRWGLPGSVRNLLCGAIRIAKGEAGLPNRAARLPCSHAHHLATYPALRRRHPARLRDAAGPCRLRLGGAGTGHAGAQRVAGGAQRHPRRRPLRHGRRRLPSGLPLDPAHQPRDPPLHRRRSGAGGAQRLRSCLRGRQRRRHRRRRGDPGWRGGGGRRGPRARLHRVPQQARAQRLPLCRQPGQAGSGAGRGRVGGTACDPAGRARR